MNIDVLAVLFATAWYNLIKILVQVSISLKLTVSFKFKLLKPSVFANIKLQLEGSVEASTRSFIAWPVGNKCSETSFI